MLKTINRNDIANYIGVSADPTPWHTITQEQVNQFADCTLDHQFIHVDPERAKQTPFGGPIAHGFLTLSLLSHFAESNGYVIEGHYMGVNYGFEKIRFLTPVPVGSRIRGHAKTLNIVEKKPGQFMSTTEMTVEIEGVAKPALIAQWITMQMVA